MLTSKRFVYQVCENSQHRAPEDDSTILPSYPWINDISPCVINGNYITIVRKRMKIISQRRKDRKDGWKRHRQRNLQQGFLCDPGGLARERKFEHADASDDWHRRRAMTFAGTWESISCKSSVFEWGSVARPTVSNMSKIFSLILSILYILSKAFFSSCALAKDWFAVTIKTANYFMVGLIKILPASCWLGGKIMPLWWWSVPF